MVVHPPCSRFLLCLARVRHFGSHTLLLVVFLMFFFWLLIFPLTIEVKLVFVPQLTYENPSVVFRYGWSAAFGLIYSNHKWPPAITRARILVLAPLELDLCPKHLGVIIGGSSDKEGNSLEQIALHFCVSVNLIVCLLPENWMSWRNFVSDQKESFGLAYIPHPAATARRPAGVSRP